MSTQEDEAKRLVRYLRHLDALHKKESSTVRSILTMINRFVLEPQGIKRLSNHQQLAERMLDYEIYKKVIGFADELIQDPTLHDVFMELGRDESGEPREALVRDYMQPMPKGTLFSVNDTLDDLIRFFKSAPPEVRYYIVGDDGGSLKGIVSVNDFTRNIDKIKTTDKSTPVIKLEFYNPTPKVILNTDKMDYAASLFTEAQKIGKKITKLLVVDGNKKPVGFIGEPDIVRWETLNI